MSLKLAACLGLFIISLPVMCLEKILKLAAGLAGVVLSGLGFLVRRLAGH